MKTYRLRKDTPELKAGALLEWSRMDKVYYCINVADYGATDTTRTSCIARNYLAEEVETQPEWFERVVPVMERFTPPVIPPIAGQGPIEPEQL